MGGNVYGCIPLCLVGTESLELASAFIFWHFVLGTAASRWEGRMEWDRKRRGPSYTQDGSSWSEGKWLIPFLKPSRAQSSYS